MRLDGVLVWLDNTCKLKQMYSYSVIVYFLHYITTDEKGLLILNLQLTCINWRLLMVIPFAIAIFPITVMPAEVCFGKAHHTSLVLPLLDQTPTPTNVISQYWWQDEGAAVTVGGKRKKDPGGEVRSGYSNAKKGGWHETRARININFIYVQGLM